MLYCDDCKFSLIHFKTVERADGFLHLMAACTNCQMVWDLQLSRLKQPQLTGEALEQRKNKCSKLIEPPAKEWED